MMNLKHAMAGMAAVGAMAAMLSANAWAHQPAVKAEPKKAAPEPVRKPPPRRSVQADIISMPRPAPPPAPYRPALAPRPGQQPLTPPPPVQVNSCDPGGCIDTGGTRYQGGVGNTVLSPEGKPCIRSGTTVQCF